MRNLLIVIGRECRARLRLPAFWVLTLLVPVVLAVIYVLPVLAAARPGERTTVLVVDQTGLFAEGLCSTEQLAFKPMPSLDYARQQLGKDELILFVPLRETTIPHDAFLLYMTDEPTAEVKGAVGAQLQVLLRNAILEDVYHLEPSVYHSVESTYISLHTQDAATGRQSHAQVKEVLAVVLAVLMALALVVFGVQLFKAVQEERQSRVAEVMATSIGPVQLLAGKVVGVMSVAVLQLVLWVALTAAAIAGIQAANADTFAAVREQQQKQRIATKGEAATAQYSATVKLVDQTVEGMSAIRFPAVVAAFLGFFLMGYMFYGSLLALLASLIGNDADALGWTLIAGSPLIAALVLAPFLIRGQAAGLAVVLMLVPFTSPVAAMLRIPFGIPLWLVATSAAVLLVAAAGAAVVAARVYRRRLLA